MQRKKPGLDNLQHSGLSKHYSIVQVYDTSSWIQGFQLQDLRHVRGHHGTTFSFQVSHIPVLC